MFITFQYFNEDKIDFEIADNYVSKLIFEINKWKSRRFAIRFKQVCGCVWNWMKYEKLLVDFTRKGAQELMELDEEIRKKIIKNEYEVKLQQNPQLKPLLHLRFSSRRIWKSKHGSFTVRDSTIAFSLLHDILEFTLSSKILN